MTPQQKAVLIVAAAAPCHWRPAKPAHPHADACELCLTRAALIVTALAQEGLIPPDDSRASALKQVSIAWPVRDHDPLAHWLARACPACDRCAECGVSRGDHKPPTMNTHYFRDPSPSATTPDEPASPLPDAKGQEPA